MKSQKRSLNRRKNSLSRRSGASYDKFEERILLAGDVRVFEFNSKVFLFGDRADNQVEIMAAPNGDVMISGQEGTTINGNSDPHVLPGRNGTIGSLRANVGAGDDLLRVEGVEIDGSAIVYGGSGDDAIGFYDTQVLDQLFVQSWSGDDAISLDDVEVGSHLTIFSLGGDDVVGIDLADVSGRTTLATGSGSDDIAVRDSLHRNTVLVFGQSGNDLVATDGLVAGGFLGVLTGGGSDDVFVADTNVQGRALVRGGGGSDRLELNGDVNFRFDPRVSSFEGNDVAGGILQTNQVYTDLIVSGSRLGTITELAVLTPQLSTLVGALTATGLDAPLNGPGTFTAFAPLNSAFAALPAGTLESLSTGQLSDILKFHVSGSTIFASELVTLSSVSTLLGQGFSVDLSTGQPVLNGNVTIEQVDIRAKNGVIHLLNGVLIPAAS